MNYDDFFREAGQRRLQPLPPRDLSFHSSLDNEALFQLPLLAMVILTLAKGNAKPRIAELGQVVGECVERTIAGFKGSSQHIGWSANLRIRTIKALTFLERTGLAQVTEIDPAVSVTPAGRQLVNQVLDQESPLATALLTVERSFENIRTERRIRSEV